MGASWYSSNTKKVLVCSWKHLVLAVAQLAVLIITVVVGGRYLIFERNLSLVTSENDELFNTLSVLQNQTSSPLEKSFEKSPFSSVNVASFQITFAPGSSEYWDYAHVLSELQSALPRSEFLYKSGPKNTQQCGYQYTTRMLNKLGKEPYTWEVDAPNMPTVGRMEVHAMKFLLKTYPEMEYLIMLDTDTVANMAELARILTRCPSPYLYGGVMLNDELVAMGPNRNGENEIFFKQTGLRTYPTYMDGPLVVMGRKAVEYYVNVMELLPNTTSTAHPDDANLGYIMTSHPFLRLCPVGSYLFGTRLYSHPHKQRDVKECPGSNLEFMGGMPVFSQAPRNKIVPAKVNKFEPAP